MSLELLASRVAEGHPARVREVLLLFEAAGAFAAQAAEARALLPERARTFLAARLADAAPDIPLLVEAIIEAEAEGLSAQAAEARAQLPQLVSLTPCLHLPTIYSSLLLSFAACLFILFVHE